ncbi:hydantoinase/oxoprolinase family protein [Aquifex aeolicus]|uniref:N-methylhydantoinase A n=1 Tax=Aquifex aeolicus (strain VF5) TaxID=224324 RepID=O66925_AQUAE|nr:hydantoinase/oxoprolinase family protein [Aquifex aeolicus]AAC06888.1 N-methylhydantoinase A [Aquifex aeolicus VF5]
MRVYVGVDTGGTFTDFVYWDGKEWRVLKIPSTPSNPAEAVLKGLEKLRRGKALDVVHGSTVATNALLERKGAKTALITNKGFEDVIEIGRQNRERLYDLYYRKPKPLVPRELRFGLNCRINAKGEVLKPINREELKEILKALKEKGVESVAVCMLHSYANPEHEKEVEEELKKNLSVFVSLSSEILPEFREYERCSTTVINAYVSPKMSKYLYYLKDRLREGDLFRVMQSNGGLISPETASKEAVRTILSGPAGGVIGALHLGKLAGFEKLITFDMGGTSTDVSLIYGTPNITTESKIDGLPVKVPMIDINTVGAGGGSIAYVDEGGALRVGPQSAGAQPGPICYGRGGKEITVTDANLFLGRLVPEHFLGGEMKLYPELLEEPFKEMAKKIGLAPTELAEGIIKVANSSMERAIRKVSVERGYNPEEFALFSFGGAGGLHAVLLAKSLNIPKVIIPRNPGLLSAVGMLFADIVKDKVTTVMLKEEEAKPETLEKLFLLMEEKVLSEMEGEGFPPEKVFVERFLDVRYKGQSYEITIPFGENFKETFEKEHERLYGYAHRGRKIEIVNLRIKATGIKEKPPLKEFKERGDKYPKDAILGEREVVFEGRLETFKVLDREKLVYGNVIDFPAIVVEYSSTTLIPPYATAEVDRYGNLIITLL